MKFRIPVGIAVAVIVGLVGLITLNDTLVGVFYDDGLYAGLARALGTGHGYVHLHLPGAPAAVHYPPLYPVLLAPLFGALPLSAAALAAKILNLLLAAAAAGLVAWHAARTQVNSILGEGLPRWLAPVIVAAAAISIPVLATQAVLFSEPLFAVLFAAAIIAADREPPRPVLAGTFAALALLTRSIAIAAGAGIVVSLLLVRRAHWRVAAQVAGPVIVAALGWGLWVFTHGRGIDPALALNYGGLGDVMSQTGLAAFGASVLDLPRPLGALTLAWLGVPIVYRIVGLAALAVGVYGLVLLTRRSAAGWSLIGYLAILAVWPYPADRFLWVVLPWLALAWTAGAVALARRQPRLRVVVLALAACIVVGYGLNEARGLAGGWWGTTARGISANLRELLPAIAAVPDSAVVASDDEALVWLYTGRKAVPFYLWSRRGREVVEPTPAEHRAYLERQGVTHVLLTGRGSGSDRELDALLGTYRGWLVVTRVWPGGRALLRISP
jgi:hypothetical protein